MKLVMSQVDSALPAMERHDTTIVADTGQEPRTLSLWLQNGAPRKIVVQMPDEDGHMHWESSFWFLGGDLSVVQEEFAAYAFDADRMILWTDESLVPLTGFTPEERMARETDVIAQARRWLGVFGLGYP